MKTLRMKTKSNRAQETASVVCICPHAFINMSTCFHSMCPHDHTHMSLYAVFVDEDGENEDKTESSSEDGKSGAHMFIYFCSYVDMLFYICPHAFINMSTCFDNMCPHVLTHVSSLCLILVKTRMKKTKPNLALRTMKTLRRPSR